MFKGCLKKCYFTNFTWNKYEVGAKAAEIKHPPAATQKSGWDWSWTMAADSGGKKFYGVIFGLFINNFICILDHEWKVIIEILSQ